MSDSQQRSDLKLFYDLLSQPCRAVFMLLEVGKVPYQPCYLDLMKAEPNEELYDTSPTKTIPAINDNGFKLFDSAAILKYLVIKYKLADHWYPANNPERQAKIDEYLFWHISEAGLRRGTAGYMVHKHIVPTVSGEKPNDEKVQEGKQILARSLSLLEDYFLKSTKFINSSEISIADIQAVCEITQFWIVDVDLFQDRPKLKKWVENVQEELKSVFDKAHETVHSMKAQGKFGKGNLSEIFQDQ